MHVPIRVIDIVTTIIWVLLIAVVALAAYSIKDMGFELYRLTATVTQNDSVVLSVPVRVFNLGYLDLKSVKVTTTLFDAGGVEISKTSTLVEVVPQRQNVSLLANLTLQVHPRAQEDQQNALVGRNFTISVSVASTFGGLLPAELSTDFSHQFDASFSGLALGQRAVGVSSAIEEKNTAPVGCANYAFPYAGKYVSVGANDRNSGHQVIPHD
jgi:hypothetical protein